MIFLSYYKINNLYQKMKDKINFLEPTNRRRINLIFRLLIFFFNYSLISNKIVPKTLYVKTKGQIKDIKTFENSSQLFANVSNVKFDFYNDIYMIEVNNKKE